jgi:hypothetical protein
MYVFVLLSSGGTFMTESDESDSETFAMCLTSISQYSLNLFELSTKLLHH